MRINSRWPVLLLAAAPANAELLSAMDTMARAKDSFHKFALRHSAGLARDLRRAFRSMAVETQPTNQQQVFCTRPDPFGQSNATSPATGTSSGTAPAATATNGATTSIYKLQESHAGSNFFDGWGFWDTADPTHGTVNYTDQNFATASGLVSINSAGHAIMRVDTTPVVQNGRNSVRITTQNTFTGGLFILDAVHMPTGCGTWPAFWSNGPNWPAGGEIDIVEGVGDYTNNQCTIHTNPGCTMPDGSTPQSLGIQGTVVGGTNCAAAQTGNQGCGIRANSDVSFGAAFNNNGGGVYAMLWDNNGIAVYFFPRNSIPADISNGAPLPTTWGQPMGFWPASSCNPSQFFYNHVVIFDTTLCGDWQGGVWGSSGIPGQEQSCQQRTGAATCQDYVLNNGADFTEAYWEVSSLKIYQTTRTP